MWILIVEAESGTQEFLVQAETRPEFSEFWDTDEPVTSHRWVELKDEKKTPKYTYWLL